MLMLSRLAWLALEVKYLDRARSFYRDTLELPVRETANRQLTFTAGETDVICRRPTSVPRGGLHTHFAFSIPGDEYDDWWTDLGVEYELEEVQFGEAKSLYLDDPDDHCVELGQRDVDGPGIDGIFEVVLEVSSLERAESFYRDLGFEPLDRGEDRRRVRLDGPMALELWEPQLGLADARGGVHVDLGFESTDPEDVADAIADRACSIDRREGSVVIRDPDGHWVTVT